MNSIIMSIRPEWSEKILNGIKTEEIRKNLGKLKPPFKVYAYVTKGKPYLQFNAYENQWELTKSNDKKRINPNIIQVNGKVCFEFVVDKFESISAHFDVGDCKLKDFDTCSMNESKLLQASCLSKDELHKYFFRGRCCAYSLHISELKVYDKPRELGEFSHYKKKTVYSGMDCPPYVDEVKVPLSCSPQSWCYVEEKQDE